MCSRRPCHSHDACHDSRPSCHYTIQRQKYSCVTPCCPPVQHYCPPPVQCYCPPISYFPQCPKDICKLPPKCPKY